MKIEIYIEKNGEKNGEKKPMEKDAEELMDEQKAAIGQKLKKGYSITRKERTLLAKYLLNEDQS